MEERKSMGSALVDVFDAGVSLAKSEINNVTRKVGDMAKAKGLGVVLLLAAVGPLILALIFLILGFFYLLSLWLPAWGAAFVIALISLAVTGALVFLGMRKLGAEVPSDEPLVRRNPELDDGWRDEYKSPVTKPVDVHRDARAAGDPTRTSGEARNMPDQSGTASVRVEQGTVNVPVYESKPDGGAQLYGSNLNEKLAGSPQGTSGDVKNPVTLRHTPGLTVSTRPTFKEDERKGDS